jgi:hypothetical protein
MCTLHNLFSLDSFKVCFVSPLPKKKYRLISSLCNKDLIAYTHFQDILVIQILKHYYLKLYFQFPVTNLCEYFRTAGLVLKSFSVGYVILLVTTAYKANKLRSYSKIYRVAQGTPPPPISKHALLHVSFIGRQRYIYSSCTFRIFFSIFQV